MMQASTSPASFFLRVIFREGPSQAQFKMYRYFGKAAFVLAMAFLWSGPVILAQQSKVAAAPRSGPSPETALSLARPGPFQAEIAGPKQAMTGQVPAPTRKQARVLG